MSATKKSFKLNRHENGEILKIYNKQSKKKNILAFRHVCINNECNKILSVDECGILYIFDLNKLEFWTIQDYSEEIIIYVTFVDHVVANVLIVTTLGKCYLLNIDSIVIIQMFNAIENDTVKYSNSNLNTILLATEGTYIIASIENFQIKSKLKVSSVRQIGIIPNSSKLYMCFNDDSIQILINYHDLEIQFYPLQLCDQFLQQFSALQLMCLNNHNHDNSSNTMQTNSTISTISFNTAGTVMCICTFDHLVLFFSTNTWQIMNVYTAQSIVIVQFEFCTNENSRAAVVSSANDAYVLNLNTLDCHIFIKGKANKLVVSEHILAAVLNTGKVLVYDLEVFLNALDCKTQPKIDCNPLRQDNKVNENITTDFKFNRHRLRSVLQHYQEYPNKYRMLIWKSILKLPENKETFGLILEKGLHQRSTQHFDRTFPIKDVSAGRNLKRIISCLAHWSDVFAHCEFLPNFVFPFIKIFPNNLLICFEIIATLLLNHCHLWFEFAPLEPINYLGIIDNVLGYFEPNLMKFYVEKNVSHNIYAWSLLKNAFTEVLDTRQWLQLWDNIISNCGSFLVLSIVAYNALMKHAIMQLPKVENITEFFQNQNLIDMKKFLRKTYELMDICPKALHPKNYIKPFAGLLQTQYQPFNNYPKSVVKKQDEQLEQLKEENRLLNQKMYELEKVDMIMSDNLTRHLILKEHESRLKMSEEAANKKVELEEERIGYQKKYLLLYQTLLQQREMNLFGISKSDQVKL